MIKREYKRAITNHNPNYMDNLKSYYKGDPRAVAGGKKGGKNKSIWELVRLRRKCSKKCPIYDRCPFASASLEQPNKECLLRKWNKQYAKGLVNLISRQEQGMDNTITILMNMLYAEILTKYKTDIKQKRGLLNDLMNVKKAIYGDKRNINLKGDMNVNIENILQKIRDEVK